MCVYNPSEGIRLSQCQCDEHSALNLEQLTCDLKGSILDSLLFWCLLFLGIGIIALLLSLFICWYTQCCKGSGGGSGTDLPNDPNQSSDYAIRTSCLTFDSNMKPPDDLPPSYAELLSNDDITNNQKNSD